MKSALILEDLEIPGIGKMRLYLEEGYSESLEEICTYLSLFKIKNIKYTMFNDEKNFETISILGRGGLRKSGEDLDLTLYI